MPQEKRAPYDFNRVLKFTPQDNNMINTDKKDFIETWAFIAPNPKFDPKAAYTRHRYTRALEARVYVSRNGGTNYCKFWAHSRDGEIHTRGHGSAGGWGYDRVSAAIDSAVAHAGFELESDFSGYGEGPTRLALQAIAKRLGWKVGELMQFHY